ncbi:murein L,D-transpeptidase catalytic domain family protein [Roseovarius sp. EL26]|uniref:murein L,D-transpeptidase catalytic domain family protein n=1 Tax=Roseovarius sp. EL26 TaxID=2126672 RepID=UPI000EA264E6|nr:murein L,D-transpeptidase catalytic domain family protein [Roseovarius sp. EL26]
MILKLRQCAVAAMAIVALSITFPSQASALSSGIPSWLQKHVGTGNDQIAPVVLERARALYQKKLRSGAIKNPCYLAMDATRPSASSNGSAKARFYVICENKRSFKAVSSGYGNGRKLQRANFANGRQCARNFSNAEGSKLTAGGSYVTAEFRTSFKGYYSSSGTRKPFHRTFLLFDGEGETSNARERAIGGHRAMFLKWQCRFKNPQSPYADEDGYTPYGRLVDYTSGRSNGCTTWSRNASKEILALVENNPTTLYIYPESKDINAVAKAVKRGKSPAKAGLYWNAACLKAIGAPKFWPKKQLQPIINSWRQSLPEPKPYKLPICK